MKCGNPDCEKESYALFDGLCIACAKIKPVSGPTLKVLREYHSTETNKKRRLVRMRKARLEGRNIKRNCKWCGSGFYTERNDKVFCSEECRKENCNRRHRDRKREKRAAS